MYTFGSDEGIAAVKAAVTEPYHMELATWSHSGKAEFRAVVAAGSTALGRQIILSCIDGGGDETSHERFDRVGFTLDPEAFGRMIDGLVTQNDNGSEAAGHVLSTIADSLGVEWV